MRTEGLQHLRGVHDGRGQPGHFGSIGVGDHCETGDITAPCLTRPRGDRVERDRAGDQRSRGRSVGDVGDLGLQGFARRGARRRASRCADAERGQRFVQPVVERTKLEEVEQPLHFLVVGRHGESVELDLDRGVAAQRHHLEVVSRATLVLDQRRLQLRGLLTDVSEDAIEAAVLVQQLGRGLLPHPGHAFQVVTGVAAQRRVLGVERRRDTRLLLDAGLVVERVVADAALVVEHLHVWIVDELVAVAVAGDDHHVVPLHLCLLGECGEDVVGLPAGQVEHGDVERGEHLTHQPHLLAQDVGRRLPLGLVGRVGHMAERRFGAIERHQHRVGLLVLDHVDEHRGEPEHRVGDLPGRRRHVGGQRVERAIGQGVSVQQQQLHGDDSTGATHRARQPAGAQGWSVPARMRSATSRMRLRSLIAVRWMNVNASCSFSPC